jgi:hypothetical protein
MALELWQLPDEVPCMLCNLIDKNITGVALGKFTYKLHSTSDKASLCGHPVVVWILAVIPLNKPTVILSPSVNWTTDLKIVSSVYCGRQSVCLKSVLIKRD